MIKHSYCEVYVKYVLPAIRLLIAKELIEKHGYTQLEVAKALGISQPLLNYYLTGRRSPKHLSKIAASERISKIVRYFANCVKKDEECAEKLPCTLCRVLKESGEANRIIKAIGMEPESVIFPLCLAP